MAQDIIPGFKDMPFTMSRYTYCYNNPVLLVDRNGMFLSLETVTIPCRLGNAFTDGVDSAVEALSDVIENVTGWITDITKFT